MSQIVHFSESAMIALHSLTLIAQNAPHALSSKSMAQVLDASENTIAKVMQRMVKDNFVNSTRGPQGGFTLARLPEKISLLSIFEAIEGDLQPLSCPFNRAACPFTKCMFSQFSSAVTEQFKAEFGDITLDQYLKK
ncbi:MAG: Rrf2 family transcriptional regulator [Spirochaetales bacterium]|nr:Rrf2 family transcriptional regulator [Spirochaetales bacterium]